MEIIATWISAIATAVGALAAVAAVFVAYFQLTNLNDTLRINSLMAVLQLEAELNARKEKVDEVAGKIKQLNLTKPEDIELIKVLGEEMNGYLENWINSADRLAFCILKKYVPERDWKTEYRPYFTGLINEHVQFFQANSHYTNILDLHNKWKRE